MSSEFSTKHIKTTRRESISSTINVLGNGSQNRTRLNSQATITANKLYVSLHMKRIYSLPDYYHLRLLFIFMCLLKCVIHNFVITERSCCCFLFCSLLESSAACCGIVCSFAVPVKLGIARSRIHGVHIKLLVCVCASIVGRCVIFYTFSISFRLFIAFLDILLFCQYQWWFSTRHFRLPCM